MSNTIESSHSTSPRSIIDRAARPLLSAMTLALLAGVAPQTASAAPYELKPFWRGDSLPADSFLSTRGHPLDGGSDYWPCSATGTNLDCALDIQASRWDGSSWSSLEAGASPGTLVNADNLIFDTPLYSPVDGEVIACWRGIPDDLDNIVAPQVDTPPECAALPGGDCAAGGNNIVIKTADNHLILLAHLKQNSIPQHLCPIPAGTPTPFTGSGDSCSTGSGVATMTRLDLINPGQPLPQVKQGELIGRAGESGQAGGPHVHFSVAEVTFPGGNQICRNNVMPIFSEAWQQAIPSGAPLPKDWNALTADPLPIAADESVRLLLHGDPVAPASDVDPFGVAGSEPAVVQTFDGTVAAYRNANGNLVLRSSTFDADDQLWSADNETDIVVNQIDLARIDSSTRHVVAITQDSATKLTLIPYHVASNHTLTRGTPVTESTPGAGLVAATRSPLQNGVVAAIQNSLGAISVIPYVATQVGTTISLTRTGGDASPSTDDVSDLDVATLASDFDGVVTIERRLASNNVWLRTWEVDASDAFLTDGEQVRDGASALTAIDVDVAVVGQSPQYVVASVATASHLIVQLWEVDALGVLDFVDQYKTASSPWVSAQLSSAHVGDQDVMVGLATTNGNLSLLSFHVDPVGTINRTGTMDGRQNEGLSLFGHANNGRLVTLQIDDGKVIQSSYRTNYSASL